MSNREQLLVKIDTYDASLLFLLFVLGSSSSLQLRNSVQEGCNRDTRSA